MCFRSRATFKGSNLGKIKKIKFDRGDKDERNLNLWEG